MECRRGSRGGGEGVMRKRMKSQKRGGRTTKKKRRRKRGRWMKVHVELDGRGLLTLNKVLALLADGAETGMREKCEGFLFHFLLLFR